MAESVTGLQELSKAELPVEDDVMEAICCLRWEVF